MEDYVNVGSTLINADRKDRPRESHYSNEGYTCYKCRTKTGNKEKLCVCCELFGFRSPPYIRHQESLKESN